MVTKEELGERIKKVMKERDVTQKMLADKIGITQSKISNYVNGKNFPPVDVLASIAEELHISLDCLVYGIPESKDEPSEQTYEFNTCGDVARMLFSLADETNIRIVSTKEINYVYNPVEKKSNPIEQIMYSICFGVKNIPNDDSIELNKFLGEWKRTKNDLYEGQKILNKVGGANCITATISELFASWKAAQVRELSSVNLQKEDPLDLIIVDGFDEDDDGELPF